ncbi:uncharacterized protein LOC117647266 isoform X1 [Thrips palmi]|uniref:Gustatory receptor n=1 Tax=Thrips palmi TaxID=161013 RepID=A0A6P8Z445_THRPL|nr:uncharacterized protein LOC117647266 isoform X1 [Thrips palmi]
MVFPKPRRCQRDPDLLHKIRHLVLLGRFTLGWPIHRTHHGYQRLPLWSCAAALRLAWMAVLFGYVTFVIQASMSGFYSVHFVEKIVKIFHLIMESWLLLVPLVHWTAAAGVANYFNSWRRFQARWVRVTGTPFEEAVIRESTANWLATAIVTAAVSFLLAETQVAPDMYAWKWPLYSVSVVSYASDMTVWCVLTYQMGNVCRELRRHLKRELDAGPVPVEVLQEYFLLWLRLRDLLLGLVPANELAWVRWMAFMGITAILSLFVTCATAVIGDYRRARSLMLSNLCHLSYIIAVAVNCGFAEHEVGRGLRMELLALRMQRLDPECRDQVFRFLLIMHRAKVRVVLGGGLVVNKSLPVKFSNLALTYMTVLAQFTLAVGLNARDDK